MKITLSSILKSLYLFFAPVGGLLLVVGLATIIDTAFGIAKAKKENEPVTSKEFRTGFVPKTLGYLGVVILVFLLDTLILNELIKTVLDFNFFATKIVSLVLIMNEVKSMDESWVVIKGYSFIDKFKESITQIKDIKKQIK
jgi:hypothetical protein